METRVHGMLWTNNTGGKTIFKRMEKDLTQDL